MNLLKHLSEDSITGDLISRERYTFADKALISAVVRDTVEIAREFANPNPPGRRIVADGAILHVWTCPKCTKNTDVTPDYYEENGTPVCCDCDEDMTYLHTTIFE